MKPVLGVGSGFVEATTNTSGSGQKRGCRGVIVGVAAEVEDVVVVARPEAVEAEEEAAVPVAVVVCNVVQVVFQPFSA